jgi:hypothetical protein
MLLLVCQLIYLEVLSQTPNGGEPGDSSGRNSPGGNLLREQPFNPYVGSFGWPTPDSCMFVPP